VLIPSPSTMKHHGKLSSMLTVFSYSKYTRAHCLGIQLNKPLIVFLTMILITLVGNNHMFA